MAPQKKATMISTGASEPKGAKKAIAVGDQIFDFELETEEAGVTANIKVSDCSRQVSLCFAVLLASLIGCCIAIFNDKTFHHAASGDPSRLGSSCWHSQASVRAGSAAWQTVIKRCHLS
jgi:hypothetical protein